MKNISIIGSGSFGCALAYILSKRNNVKIWSYTKEEADMINNEHRCMFLKNLLLDNSIKCYLNYEEAISNSEIIILVTPSSVFKQTCTNIKEYVTNQEIVIATKGMVNDKLLSHIVKEELGKESTVISGPSHAEQIVRNIPTFIDYSGNIDIKDVFETDTFKLNYIDDKIGIEVGASLKNILSLGCGILEGMNYESNTISYFITEGLKEIKEIGLVLGSKENTFYGLSGLGDLLTTAFSMDSRNKRAGLLIGKGKTLDEVKNEIGMTIEGLDSLKCAYLLIEKYNLECKLIKSIYDVIYCKKELKSIF